MLKNKDNNIPRLYCKQILFYKKFKILTNIK